MKYTNIIKRETKVLVGVVIVLVVMVLGVSYSMFIQNKSSRDNQVVKVGTLQVEYSSRNGYITGGTYSEIVPKSDTTALGEASYDFSVKNTGTYSVTYNVYLFVNEEDFNKDKAAGKVSENLFNDLENLKYNIKTNSNNNSTVLAVGNQNFITENGIKKYKIAQSTLANKNDIDNHSLRLWLSENTSASEIGKYIYLKLEVASYVSGQEPQ